MHIINVDIQDNQEEATIGAFFICELVNLVIDLFSIKLYVLQRYTGHSIGNCVFIIGFQM